MFNVNIVTIISSPFELISFIDYNYYGRLKQKCTAHGATRGELKEYLKLINPWHRSVRYFDRITLCSGYTFVNVGSENVDTRLYIDINTPRDEIKAKYYKPIKNH